VSIRGEAIEAVTKVVRDGGPIYGVPEEMAAEVVDDVLGRIAADLNRCADGLGEFVPPPAGQDRHDYEVIATTLRNTAWAVVHGDQAENLREPDPAPEPETPDARF
jgi:hypothetical protein